MVLGSNEAHMISDVTVGKVRFEMALSAVNYLSSQIKRPEV